MNTSFRKVFVHDYAIKLIIGINEAELSDPQNLLISVELYLESPTTEIHDSIQNVFNYEWIPETIEYVAEEPRMNLLETFAEKLIRCFFKDSRVIAARIKIEKPDICPKAKALGFEMYQLKKSFQ